MILGGAVAGQGETSIVLTIGVVWAAALAGDSVSFLLGRRLGRDFLLRHGPKVRITRERFARVEDYFSRHGGKTIVIGRFIGLVRALAPFTAGSSGMRYGYYLPFAVLGTGLWAVTFGLIGYFASQSLDAARARRRAGHAAVRDRGRRDRGDRRLRSASCASRTTGHGWSRGWSAMPRCARCWWLGAGSRPTRASLGAG